MNKILVLILFFLPSLAIAGGTSWQIEILSFERVSEIEARATIKTITDTKYFNECEEIKLDLSFNSGKINSTHIKKLVSKKSQTESLNSLESRSSHAKAVMLLGSMGSGFKKIAKCEFKSAGLGLITEYNGRKVIYSFHDPI